MSEIAEKIATVAAQPGPTVAVSVLRLLAEDHSDQAAAWRVKAEQIAGDDGYLKGYLDALTDVAIGNRRLAVMVEAAQ